MSTKTFFGCIDLRNAKFQGSIKNDLPDGLGIAINQQFLLALTNWKAQQPYGPFLLVFSNRDYLYGRIKNKKLQGPCNFVKASGSAYFLNLVNGVADRIAYLELNDMITEMVSSEGKLKAGRSWSLKDKENSKWDTISNILGLQFPSEMKSIRHFVRDVFQKEFYDIIESSESSGLMFIGFKHSASLGVKFDRDDKVRQVGSFEPFPRLIDFGRKYSQTIGKSVKTEQGKFSDPQKVFVYEGSRPLEATKYTEQFFKRGTNFKNSFFKFGCIDDIENFVRSVERQVGNLSIRNYGLKIIEDKEKQEDYCKNRQYTISQIKKEIYEAVQRRKNGHKTDRASPERERIQPVQTPFSELREVSNNKDLSSNKKTNLKRYIYSQEVNEFSRRQSPVKDRSQLNQFTLYEPTPRPRREIHFPEKFDEVREERIDHLSHQLLLRNFNLEQEILRARIQEGCFALQNPRLSPSPSKPIFKATRDPKIYLPRDKSAHKLSYQQPMKSRQDPEYPNYSRYKYRNKTPTKASGADLENRQAHPKDVYLPQKYQIYSRRVATTEITEHKNNNPRQKEGSNSPAKEAIVIPTRHKKNFKYL